MELAFSLNNYMIIISRLVMLLLSNDAMLFHMWSICTRDMPPFFNVKKPGIGNSM